MWSLWECNKQWPLAGEFVEFEYSPKIRQFVEFEYSPKWPFWRVWPDSIHSSAIRQLLSPDSIHSTDIRQPFSPDSIHSTLNTFADIRQNVTRIRHIRTSNLPFWRIWGEWPLLRMQSSDNINRMISFNFDHTFRSYFRYWKYFYF